MFRDALTYHSTILDKDLGLVVYGEKGHPVIVFQTQNSPATSFEEFGMLDELADYVDNGLIQLFSVEANDQETWSDWNGDKSWRSRRIEDYFRFVTDELLPFVHERNGSELRPLTTGCSMGATHAAIAALRRPDLFQGCIALSGVYRTSFFFGDWMDHDLYMNDMVKLLADLPADHPYVQIYNERQLVFCTGQGAGEEGIEDLRQMQGNLERLHVESWCDFWGYDVNHDWPWWKKQMRYFLPFVLEDMHRTIAAEKKAEEDVPDLTAEPKEPKKPAAKTSAKTASKPAAKKAAPKAESKPAAKPAAKPAPKAEPKAAAKTEAKTSAPKTEPKPVAKAAAKPAAKAEPKAAAPKAEAKPAAKPAAKPEPAPKAAPAAKPAPKAAPAPAEKAAPKAEAKPAAKADPKPAAKTSAKTPARSVSAARKKSSRRK